jgi:DNA helicase-2/ATP-dependent DNA helicase PcrA
MIDFEKELNKEQLKVVLDGDGHCLVLSGPGSGKTRTLVYRAAYLLQKGVPASQILLLTFTKKAAKEMLNRIYKISGMNEKEICGGTFHHTGNLFLRTYAERLGYSSNFIILDEEDSRSIISGIIKEEKINNAPKAPVIQKIISLSVNSKKTIKKTIEEYFSYFEEEIADIILEIAEKYQKRKKDNNLMDYDDLLFNWNEILSIPDIQKNISERFLYILVDEYQDTNALQNEIIKKIGQLHKNILAVGDDAQSIYSFRAADIENILNFSKEYKSAKIFKLESNYRSTEEILDIANAVIKNNDKKLEKELKSLLGKGAIPEIIPFSNPREQAKHIADYIVLNGNISEIAILFRAHHHAVELEMELAKRKIPYILRGGIRFFEQFHTKDVMAFLRIMLNFHDEPSWKRLLLRQEGVGEVSARKIIEKIFLEGGIEDVLGKKEEIYNANIPVMGINGLKTILPIFESCKEKEISEKIDIFLNSFYNHYLDFSFENAKERKNDLKKLKEISMEYENLEEMISDFSLSEDFQKEEKLKDAVVLSTVHQAKGLEWETVFVISLKEGDFPHSKAIEEDMIEEERRLFYVAVTRCKKNLFLTYPLYNFREKYIAPPSRFLKEAQNLFYNEAEEIIEEDGGWETF